eukprot:3165384-Amphidinium_carterae.1
MVPLTVEHRQSTRRTPWPAIDVGTLDPSELHLSSIKGGEAFLVQRLSLGACRNRQLDEDVNGPCGVLSIVAKVMCTSD